MKAAVVLASVFASTVLAAPAVLLQRQYVPCSGLYGDAQCCATDVLGVADLDCANPPEVPTNPSNFSAVCAAIGQRARCCAIPILGQGVLCDTPTGVES